MARLRSVCDEFEPKVYHYTYPPASLGLQMGGRRPVSVSISSGSSDQDVSASSSEESALVNSRERDIDVEGHSSISADSWASDFEDRLPNLSERLLSQGEGVVFDDTWDETFEGQTYKYDIKYAGQVSWSSSDPVDEEDEDDKNPSSRWLSSRQHRRLRLTLTAPTEDLAPIPDVVIDHEAEDGCQPTKRFVKYTRCQRLRLGLMRTPAAPCASDELLEEEDATSEVEEVVDERRFAKRRRCDP